jgi:protein-S-isoprenylcysteine O-methyltransferase Ste14
MPPGPVLAEIVWCACVSAWFLLRLPHQVRSWKEPIRTSERDFLDWSVLTFMVLCNGAIPFAYVVAKVPRFANYPFVPALAWIGGALFVCALWLFYRTHRDLGRNWSMSLEIRREHRLITGGVYRYVRHPMYLAFLMWGLAQTLLLPNWIAGPAGLVGSTTLVLWRVGREERLMLKEFGEEYRAYMRRTKRLLPWLV